MIDQKTLKEYNEFRNGASLHTLCPAPSMNLHFSQLGIVTACCFNRTKVMGVYPKHSLDEIWNSDEAQKMREELQAGKFPIGCEKCREQILSKDFGGSHANFYSQQAKYFRITRAKRNAESGIELASNVLPMKLEFNIHNNCNLQCIMCHGLASSSIRVHREGLPAMPNPYDDAFVEQLKVYLPQVVETDFMGGEPFMIGAYKSIWKAISEVNPKIKTCILTNATILNDAIKSLLESFNCWIHISIDSFKKETYETIRKGASFEEVMENSNYFNQLMKARGLNLVWRYCPMRINWHELPDTVRYCTEQDIKLFFNQVDSPINMSLTTLPVEELQKVIDTLKAEEPKLPTTEVALENLKNYRELIFRLSGYLTQTNRSNALQSRLQAASAVVGQYTAKRENAIKKRKNRDELNEQLSPIFRGYFINRLNVEQAEKAKTTIEQTAYDLLLSSHKNVIDMTAEVSIPEFLEIYIKELARVVSGIWGVTKAHNRELFKQIDDFITTISEDNYSARLVDKKYILGISLLKTYEKIATATSVSSTLEELFVLQKRDEITQN
ncbi:twitch domain-containing radical SAM protein [uncultured Kordia sp.]|uniref:twitch domain-containing radical SAM protein n=1 Tax=uncultured Kordia sp. TaxID=507699 RepID=UPI0026394885|nr:twitch domain-containing radical SAM protein [uncultured Kordia sp.]